MFRNDGDGGKKVPVYEYVSRTKDIVDSKFRKKHNLSSSSKPHEFVDVFLPLNKSKGKGLFPTEETENVPDFQGDFQTTIWINLKAKLAGTGPGGSYYLDFKDFTTLEICQYMFIYIFNGLSPSPRLKMKFNAQSVDRINGNDFIATTLSQNSFGTRQRHAMFKSFLSIQNPLIDPSPRAKYPNWKIRPLLAWMNFIFPTAWLLDIALAAPNLSIPSFLYLTSVESFAK